MINKNKTITLYFNNNEDIYNILMSMNKFYRAEYIRSLIRADLLAKHQDINNFSINNIGKTIEMPHQEKNHEEWVVDIQENNDPFDI